MSVEQRRDKLERLKPRVIRWIAHHFAEDGFRSVYLVEAGSPEDALLLRWLNEAGLPLHPPGHSSADATAVPAEHIVPSAIVAERIAQTRRQAADVMLLSSAHKSRVLLDGAPDAFIPLGDIWGGELASHLGRVRLPEGIESEDDLGRLERALEVGIREGCLRASLIELDEAAAPSLEARLRRAARRNRGPSVPKLGSWTVGVDPPIV